METKSTQKSWRPILTFDKRDNLIPRNQRVNLPPTDEQPFLGTISFNYQGKNVFIEKIAIYNLSLDQKNKRIKFSLTDILLKHKKYEVSLSDINFLKIDMPHSDFKKKFKVQGEKLYVL